MARSGIIEYFDIDGSYQTITGGQVVNKDDLIELAKVAQNKNLYDKAITYLQEASRYVCYCIGGTFLFSITKPCTDMTISFDYKSPLSE